MNAIALVLVACLPHLSQCKSIVQHPTPNPIGSAPSVQRRLTGTIDDTGYQPIQVTCMYARSDQNDE